MQLKASRFLIVICSPNSAESEWVGKEINYFCSVNSKENIYLFIINGEPFSACQERECYNPELWKVGFVNPLGVNIREKTYSFPFSRWNVERAYIQLITKLLGVNFDTLWNHHKRLLIQKLCMIFMISLTVLGLLAAVVRHYMPVDVSLILQERTPLNEYLPEIADIEIGVSVRKYNNHFSISHPNSIIILEEIPAGYLGEEVSVTVEGYLCSGYDTTFKLSRENEIFIFRDDMYYGHINFILMDKDTHKPLPYYSISICDEKLDSDSCGVVDYFIPIERQREEYQLHSTQLIFEDAILQPPFISNERVVMAKPI